MTNLITNRGIFQKGSWLVLLAFAITACLQSVSRHPVGSAAFTTERIIPQFGWTTPTAADELNSMQEKNKGWPRNSSTGLGGGLSTYPGGGLSTLPGGGASTGPNGGMSTGPGGGLSTGPGGGLSTGPGGGLSTGPGGGLSTGPGGGLSTGPGGGLSTGSGGGLSTGTTPYYRNIPPRPVYLKYLKEHGYGSAYKTLSKAWGIQ